MNIIKDSSDEELLQWYRKSRKAEYLVELYGRYMTLVYGVALKYLKNIPDAQDAVTQMYEDLTEKVLRHDIQVFKPWLYVCVRNYCLMELRKRSGSFFVELDERFMDFCDDFNLDDIKESDEKERFLQDCLEALPEKQKICVRYFFMDEFSYKDIEDKSGFSLKMVKSFIQNGKRNLQLCLKQKGIY